MEEIIEKIKMFDDWLYNRKADYEYDGMTEEIVGLNDAIGKWEELGLGGAVLVDKARRKERRCLNERYARDYASLISPYYENILVEERQGKWFVSYDE